MRPPAFWYPETPPALPARLVVRGLLPLGMIYNSVAQLRRRFVKPQRVGVPVVCVGNIIAGGAGKTPIVIHIAERLAAMGVVVHCLARGYGGRLGGPVRVRATHTAHDVGDEALLIAQQTPIWVARHRVRGARAAEESGADVILMDDGFQNPSLAKDVSFLVMDAQLGVGNGRVLPAGPLRETLTSALLRASAMILLGAGAEGDTGMRAAEDAHVRVLRARIVPAKRDAVAGKRVIAFSGIAHAHKFHASLKDAGAEIVARYEFGDHHVYRARDAARLLARANEMRACLATTEKDAMRLKDAPKDSVLGRLARASLTLPIRVLFDNPAALDTLLKEKTTHALA